MASDNRKFIEIQIEALLIRQFIVVYDELETEIRNIFTENISIISPQKKELLFFYLAGIKSNVHIDYGNRSLSVVSARYCSNENFSMFTSNQIIKIHRQCHLLDMFDFNIQSINNKNTEYTFTDSYIKLLNMRNKLAHELSHLVFKDSDVIELLANDYIEKNSSEWLSYLDAKLMTDESKSIFSNLIMMNVIIKEQKRRKVQNVEAVDSE